MNEKVELIQKLLPALVPVVGFGIYMLTVWLKARSDEEQPHK